MKLCPNCHRAFDDTLRFCSHDGHTLVSCAPARATAPVPPARETGPRQASATSQTLGTEYSSIARGRSARGSVVLALVIVVATFLVGAALGAYSSSGARPANTSAATPPVVTEAHVTLEARTVPEEPASAETVLVATKADSKSAGTRNAPTIVRISDEKDTPRRPARLTPARPKCSEKAN